MLKIENNKSYFTLQKKTKNETSITETIFKTPILNKKHLLSFDKWYEKYKDEIDEITNEFVSRTFDIKSDKFIIHFNIKNLKQQFILMLYNTSDNAFKGWI